MSSPLSNDRRKKIRTKIPRMIRVRPSEIMFEDFDEILPTLNSARNSVYFVPQNGIFSPDMRVFVTFPYAEEAGAINQEFLGRVTRVDKLPGNKQGVAVELLMPIYVGTKETIR